MKPDPFVLPTLCAPHHKVPIDAGGTNDPSNPILMKNEPFHKRITNYQNDLIRGAEPREVRVFDCLIIEVFIYT